MSSGVIAVWFSCGAASAAAAKLTLERFKGNLDTTIRVLNAPVVEEDDDNRRFLRDVETWLGTEIESVINPKYSHSSAERVWEKRQFMSSPYGAPCTLELKKNARREWEKRNEVDWHVLGFTADEQKRHDRFVMSERDNVIPVLIDAGMTKDDCYKMLTDAGLRLPRMYELGFPNANCIGCVKSASVTYWNHVRKHFPEVFERRAKQSREIGARLVIVKGERIFLDELDPEAKGNKMRGAWDCGIFCEPEGATDD